MLEDAGQDEDDIGDGHNKKTKYMMLAGSTLGKCYFILHIPSEAMQLNHHTHPEQDMALLLAYG